jgi:hypothetical protein
MLTVSVLGSGLANAAAGAPPPGRISTIAGGIGGPGRATMVALTPCATAAANGELFVTDTTESAVREISEQTGGLRTVAGNGFQDYSGDGGPAVKAGLDRYPCGVAADKTGNVAVEGALRIRLIAGQSGTFFGQKMIAGDIYTVAGNGSCCSASGDGGPGTSAEIGAFDQPDVAFDHDGNLVIADYAYYRFGFDEIRVLAVRSGTFYGQKMTAGFIYRVAGSGLGFTFYGDGGLALDAGLYLSGSLTMDPSGNLVIADGGNYRIRVVAESNGTFYGQRMKTGHIYTVAGDGECCEDPGNGGPATSAEIGSQPGLAVDPAGNVLISDQDHQVRVLADRTGRFYGRAMKAGYIYQIASRQGVISTDTAGNLLLSNINRISVIAEHSGRFYGRAMTAGHFYGIVGNGFNFSGDGGPATAAELAQPAGVAVDHAGDIIMETTDALGFGTEFRIRLIAARTGSLFGRNLKKGAIYSLASPASLGTVAVDGSGNVLYTQHQANEATVIAARTGRFYGRNMKAGGSYPLALGNAATHAQPPAGLALDSSGDIAFSDGIKVRLLAAHSGTFFGQAMTAGHIYVLAGAKRIGYSGDGGPGVGAEINGTPISLDRAGNLLLADDENNRIRVVARQSGTYYGKAMTAGDIYTVAGDGTSGYSGDGGPATSAEIDIFPISAVTTDQAGNLLISDSGNDVVRVVAARTGTFYGVPMTKGDIYTIAGTGSTGFSGDGGPATKAALNDPLGIALTSTGGLLICDSNNGRIREVTG